MNKCMEGVSGKAGDNVGILLRHPVLYTSG